MFRFRSLAGLAVTVLFVAAASPALSAPADPKGAAELAEARELFARGRALEDEGRFLEALGLFQRVGEVKMTPQVRFHLALCLENTGHLALALATFKLAEAEAQTTAPNVVAEATTHIASLEKRVPTLTLVLQNGAPEDELLLDGRPVTSGASIAVDPGPHAVVVRHAGKIVSEQNVTLEERKGLRLELSPSATGLDQNATSSSAPLLPRADKTTEVDPSTGRLLRGFGWTAVGLSAASAVGLGIAVALREGRLSALDAACPTHVACGRDVAPIVNDGQTYATLVNVFAVAAGATALTGVVLLLSAPAPAAAKTRGAVEVRLGPAIAPGLTFISLEGRF